LFDFKGNLNFLDKISKEAQSEITLKSLQWQPSCSMRPDGRTAVMTLIVVFRKFSKACKNPTGESVHSGRSVTDDWNDQADVDEKKMDKGV
jgi:hypothetical protein